MQKTKFNGTFCTIWIIIAISGKGRGADDPNISFYLEERCYENGKSNSWRSLEWCCCIGSPCDKCNTHQQYTNSLRPSFFKTASHPYLVATLVYHLRPVAQDSSSPPAGDVLGVWGGFFSGSNRPFLKADPNCRFPAVTNSNLTTGLPRNSIPSALHPPYNTILLRHQTEYLKSRPKIVGEEPGPPWRLFSPSNQQIHIKFDFLVLHRYN